MIDRIFATTPGELLSVPVVATKVGQASLRIRALHRFLDRAEALLSTGEVYAYLPLVLRRRLIAVLAFALLMAGVGQGLINAAAFALPSYGVPGVATPICHAGVPGAPRSGDTAHHECCDACVLLGAALLPPGPQPTPPTAVTFAASITLAADRPLAVARHRTPRQAQGPPAVAV